jgi:hypothetical protein
MKIVLKVNGNKEKSACFKENVKGIYTAHTDLLETKLQYNWLIVGCKLNCNRFYVRNHVGRKPP